VSLRQRSDWQPPEDERAIPPVREWPSEREWARYDRLIDGMAADELRQALKAEGRKRGYWENRCARAEGRA
jgi:hypothetical protein